MGKIAVERNQDMLTMEQRKLKRQDKVYIDVMRNAYGQTSVAPYSVRARVGAPVATPLRWDEISSLESPTKYDIENIFRRIGQMRDPWHDIDDDAKSIDRALKKVERMRNE